MTARAAVDAGHWSPSALAAGFAALLLALGLDFALDIRARDALSWMDPYQYYEFALGLLNGSSPYDGFELPSIFPLFVLPFVAWSPTIAGALWVNFAALGLLFWSVHALVRELGIRTPSPVVALLVASSPLLVGLSRSLYAELTLTALVSLSFVYWLRLLRAPAWRRALPFALATGVGLMTKMTFPLFLLVPCGVAIFGRFAARRDREARILAVAVLGPIVGVLVVQASFFPGSFGYYLSLGNTAIPVMDRIGPREAYSLASLGFYFRELGRTLLFALTPLVVLAAWLQLRSALRARSVRLSSPRATLWLWLTGPLVLLILQTVKEPRHVAPCVVPAVLLAVLAIEDTGPARLRRGLLAAGVAVAILQYLAVTNHWIETPYFLDRAIHLEQISEALEEADVAEPGEALPRGLRTLLWKYRHGFALAGFPANEALAISWWAFPAVVTDLETLRDESAPAAADDAFEDPYLLAAFDTYNRRCGWRSYSAPLSREEALAHADFVLFDSPEENVAPERFPNHRPIATIARSPGWIHVLARTRDAPHTRTLVARRHLARHPRLSSDETGVVARELLLVSLLTGDPAEAAALLREFPVLRRDAEAPRNIYWIAGYRPLLDLGARRLASLRREAGR